MIQKLFTQNYRWIGDIDIETGITIDATKIMIKLEREEEIEIATFQIQKQVKKKKKRLKKIIFFF